MSEHSTAVRPATNGDRDRVDVLLEASELPPRDERGEPAAFLVATLDGEAVGAGAVERRGSDGLLRSVVVARPHRGRGLGTRVCEGLEARARERGVATLYLLTTSASAFFGDRDYDVIERLEAPPSIRKTSDFRELCPDSATCMRKSL